MGKEFEKESPGGAVVKNLPVSAGDTRDMGLILESGRPSGEGNGNKFQYSCLENSIDGGAWWAQSRLFFSFFFWTDDTLQTCRITSFAFFFISIYRHKNMQQQGSNVCEREGCVWCMYM